MCLSQKLQLLYVKHCIRCSVRLGLSPGLFLLQINDMHRSSDQLRFVHFADNTTVFASDSDINNVHASVNRELVGVDNWLKTNRLSLNVSKTSYMIISNHKNALDTQIRETILTKVSKIKFLGIMLNENLTFKNRVNNVTSNISKSVGVMRRLHCQLPANAMVKLYYSLVYSHLTCALLAWGRSGSTNAAKIECAHMRTCKLLTDYNQKILTFHSIYDYFALLKAFNTNTLNFYEYFTKTNYILINHLICTIPDTQQIVILILHYLIIQKAKNVICTK